MTLSMLPMAGLRRALGTGKQGKPRSEAERKAQVVPADPAFNYGDVRRYGMKPTASAAENSAALQRCLNASAGTTAVVVPAAGEYQLAGRILVPADTTIELRDGAVLRWVSTEASGTPFLGTPTRPGFEVTGDHFKLSGHGRICGPSEGTYVVNETGILCLGASAGQPRSGFEISDGVEICGWGSRGILAQFVHGVVMNRIKVHHCGYGGMTFLSCRDGRIQNNIVGDISPGTSGNAYGISCSHDSRHYSEDPRVDTDGRQAADHFCINFDVGFNTVHDIPVWVGIDFHGAWDCRAHDNQVFNCRHGITMQGSSDKAVDYAGANNSVTNNRVTTRRANGEETTVTAVTRLGISVNGGRRVHQQSITVRDNTIDGFGDTSNTSFSLQHTFTSNADISNNKVTNWRGYGCCSAYSDGVISDNEFGPPADDTNSACIFVAVGGHLRITGNRLAADSKRRPRFGVVINTPGDDPYFIRRNDFRAAAMRAYAGHAGSRLPAAQIVEGRLDD